MFLYGPVGTGKTCAALAFLDQAAGGGLYATVNDLVDWMLHHYESQSRWDWMESAGLMVIDELGTRTREVDVEYQAIKGAADAREHSPTIWVSNLRSEGIAGLYDERIYSRICCGTWYELKGNDRRFSP